MNLVDTEKTPLHTAFDFVKMRADTEGAPVTWSEIVGLVPEKVLFDTAVSHLQLKQFTPEQVLEKKVREVAAGGESLSGFVASVASSNPVPGGVEASPPTLARSPRPSHKWLLDSQLAKRDMHSKMFLVIVTIP